MLNKEACQVARDNAMQFKAETINIGLTLEEVKKIIKEENELLIANSRIVAAETAQARLNDYTDVLIPKLVKAEVIEAFEQPEFQVLYKKSETTAICTERKSDYEMLSELLIHKIEKKGDYVISAAIEKAIAEINNISEEALMSLTLIFAVINYIPSCMEIKKGLDVLNKLYGNILEKFQLPTTNDWKENLELVNAIKTYNFGGTKRLEDYLYDILDGYSSLGLKIDSEKYNDALAKLESNGLPTNILTKNYLNNEYAVLAVANRDNIENLALISATNGNTIKLNAKQKEIIYNIYDSYEPKLSSNKDKFIETLNNYENIRILNDWWNSQVVGSSFQLTAIGRVLACVNVVRIDNSLPNIIDKSDR